MTLHQTAPQDAALPDSDSEATAQFDGGLIAGLRDDGNRLSAMRGVVIGTVLGIAIWSAILWGLF